MRKKKMTQQNTKKEQLTNKKRNIAIGIAKIIQLFEDFGSFCTKILVILTTGIYLMNALQTPMIVYMMMFGFLSALLQTIKPIN